MYAFDDDGAYLADMDFVSEKIERMSDEDYDNMIKFCPMFNDLEPDAQLQVIEQYSHVKYVRKSVNKKHETNLKGKYVITCLGIKSKKTVYLQDRRISNGGFWTEFKSNALGFATKEEAEKVAKTFKYNNPKVTLV